MRLLITVLAAVTSLVILTSVAASVASVRITALDCGSHPRRIRIENQGDAAQNLSGWQLRSDPVEGQPWDLSEVGSIGAGQRFFVFQGHLSPPVDPVAGYYRWGTDEIFNLRANDSSDYVRIVDVQGNTVDQRNCEGLPPGATPAPTTEFDPPAVVQPTVPASTPTPSASTSTPAGATVLLSPTPLAAGGLPVGGGPPPANQRADTALWFAAGAVLLAAGTILTTLRSRRARPRP